MQVKAKKLGYYNHKRQREGAIFTLKKAEDFSPNWMEKMDAEKEEAKPAKGGRKGKAKEDHADMEEEAQDQSE